MMKVFGFVDKYTLYQTIKKGNSVDLTTKSPYNYILCTHTITPGVQRFSKDK